ncbi:hypothetical protein [Streptomyces sp. NPDC054874]
MYKGLQPPSTDLDDVGDDTELSQYGDVIYFKDAPHAGSDVWWGLSLWTDHLSVDELARRVRRRRANGADRARYTTAIALHMARSRRITAVPTHLLAVTQVIAHPRRRPKQAQIPVEAFERDLDLAGDR